MLFSHLDQFQLCYLLASLGQFVLQLHRHCLAEAFSTGFTVSSSTAKGVPALCIIRGSTDLVGTLVSGHGMRFICVF